MNTKNLTEIKEYIEGLLKISKRTETPGESITNDDKDFIIEGYELKARPVIDFLNMHNPQKLKFHASEIHYNNPAELSTKTNRPDLLNDGISFLKQVKARFEYYIQHPEKFDQQPEKKRQQEALKSIIHILEQFHSLTKIITDRRRGKEQFKFADEYDVQDILFLILKGIYPSAFQESTAIEVGKGETVIDIVIPEHYIVIEIKIIFDKSKTKSIVEALKIDFESYHTHKYCNHLISFIYDPLTVIEDPHRIISDLSGLRVKDDKQFNVTLAISPK